MKARRVIRVHFKDEGQDFLYWDVECNGGPGADQVIDSQPLQASHWAGNYLLTVPRVGRCLSYSESPKHPVYSIKYPVTKIEDVTAQYAEAAK